MVTKIPESSLVKAPRPDLGTGAPALQNTAAADKQSAPQPAARIGLSESAKASQAAQQVLPNETEGPLDTELVREIRERIAQGKFKIDYDHVASNLLREAVASTSRG